MKVYFIRHGQSEGNAKRFHQNSSASLTNIGVKQAEDLAKRFASIEIDKIISSPFKRTKHTSEIINKNLNKPIEYSQLFIERKMPSEIEGLEYQDPEAIKVKSFIGSKNHNPDFKHSDEETFFEMKKRAKEALKFLEGITEENVLVVSHFEFIVCLLGVMIFGDEYELNTDLKFVLTFKSNNTGITLCEFNEKWRIRTWNDHAHLG